MFAVSHVDLNCVNHEKDVRKKTIGNIESIFIHTVSFNLPHNSLGWVRWPWPLPSSSPAVSTLRNFIHSIDSITISTSMVSKFLFMSLTFLPTSKGKKVYVWKFHKYLKLTVDLSSFLSDLLIFLYSPSQLTPNHLSRPPARTRKLS